MHQCQLTGARDLFAMSVLDTIIKKFVSLFSKAGSKNRLLILTYHRVRERPDPVNPADPDKIEFATQMRLLAKYFNVSTISKAIRNMRTGQLPERSVCITFDDGYADNHEVAAPILEDLGLVATFFVATGYLNGGIMWNDRIIETIRRLGPGTYDFGDLGQVSLLTSECRLKVLLETINRLKYMRCEERDRISREISARFGSDFSQPIMMTDGMVRDLHVRGMEIGAHTVRHPILSRLNAFDARVEVQASKAYLESLLQDSVSSFAYPNGKYGKDLTLRDVEIVRESGFDVAVTTDWGAVTTTSNSLALPRVGFSSGNMAVALTKLCRDYRSELNTVVD